MKCTCYSLFQIFLHLFLISPYNQYVSVLCTYFLHDKTYLQHCNCFPLQSTETIFFVKGALEKILANCSRYYSQGVTLPLTEKAKQEFLREASMMGGAGLRGMYLHLHVYLLLSKTAYTRIKLRTALMKCRELSFHRVMLEINSKIR